jgi:hypothetical protein
MRKGKQLLFLLFYFPLLIYSANENTSVGARTNGMGNVSVAVADFWSLYNNQAIMPFFGKMAVGIHYDNRYLLKETSTAVVGFVLPLKNGSDVFSVNLSHYGGGNFGEMKAGIAYAKSFASVFSFGLQFDYLLDYFSDATYGKRNGFTFEVGLYGQITKSLSMGFHAYNPARLKMITYNNTTEYIPTILRLGLAYQFKEKCIVGLDVEKNLETKIQVHTGVEYAILKYLILRGGIRFPDFSFNLGIGTQLKGLSVDFSSSYHPLLGYSPQLAIIYAIR